ncbi:hypothetical protein [Nocardia sp. NPDC050435]|uniref:hypothetical protein n=1 Tax=Nocardia sp. NPDC050435 TaxID=3155040 RepID=UPI003410D55C
MQESETSPLPLELAEQHTAPLSSRYGQDQSYRAEPFHRPKWTTPKPSAGSCCDECAAMQHETHAAGGASGFTTMRMQPRHRRAFVREPGTVLRLCNLHAQAWRDRDAADLGDAAPAKGRRR